MKKVILLALLVPGMAFGQNMEKCESWYKIWKLPEPRADTDRKDSVASPGDIIITEIMADPNPVVSLPAKEYIEIHNRSPYSYDLSGWILSDGNSRCIFPDKKISPDDYLIVCQAQDTGLFIEFGKTLGVKSFPALTDGGKLLFITDPQKNLIHGVEYSSSWYGDALKEGGGWSLELIDDNYPFCQEGNWRASESADGGTPGCKNSVEAENPDYYFRGFENVFPADSLTILVSFSESTIIPGNNKNELFINNVLFDSIMVDDPLQRAYVINLETPLARGKVYDLFAEEAITDFAGNSMIKNGFSFGLPENVRAGDILFNELLFNPFSGEPDFIEFYNNSTRIINASDLLLVSVSILTGDTSSVVFVSEENRCILPGSLYVMTTDRNSLTDRYPLACPDNIFEVRSLPSMPDDKGHLILYSRRLEKIDEVSYSEKMHFSLLASAEGVSLEKIMTVAPSSDITQWHSASESSGWGTPGAPNSVLMENKVYDGIISFSSSKISPDNDGFEDFLIIEISPDHNGCVVSVNLFDETGSFVNKITDNMLIGPEASIVWDGTGPDNKLVDTGIYVILITMFDDQGTTRRWKKVCTLIRN